MKKTLLSFGAVALVLSFASCKKDYNCTCQYTAAGQKMATSQAYDNVTRADAHDACDEKENTLRNTTGFTEVSCEVND